ncbi:hypothetical protein LNP74_17380 [Klebsiella pneumoniae subsp. pneumoniae]|nr:hypothetical protein [Klebsiella pneumoniae subsp. pneumoniae]
MLAVRTVSLGQAEAAMAGALASTAAGAGRRRGHQTDAPETWIFCATGLHHVLNLSSGWREEVTARVMIGGSAGFTLL